jgi:hypothetical protein
MRLKLASLDAKILCWRLCIVFLDIVMNLLFCHCSYRGAEVSSCPEMPSPISLLQVRKLVLQHLRRPSLQILHHLGRSQSWWTRHQQMDMVLAHVPSQDLDVSTHTALPDQLSCSFSHRSTQHMIAILGHPHKVVLDIIDCVRPFTILDHCLPSLLAGFEGNLTKKMTLKLFA